MEHHDFYGGRGSVPPPLKTLKILYLGVKAWDLG